LKRLLSQV